MSVPTRTVPVPTSIVLVAERVEHRLAELLDTEIERWGALDRDLVEPLLVLRRFVVGSGKRLRPAFCQWAYVGAGGAEDDAGLIDSGAAFELLQAFALVHDDVMDGSATRRGARTVRLVIASPMQRRNRPRRDDYARLGVAELKALLEAEPLRPR